MRAEYDAALRFSLALTYVAADVAALRDQLNTAFGTGDVEKLLQVIKGDDYSLDDVRARWSRRFENFGRLGFIDGEWLKQGFGDAYEAIKQGIMQKSPLRRVSTPGDVAQMIVGLITGPDLTTGHVLPVDGGLGSPSS